MRSADSHATATVFPAFADDNDALCFFEAMQIRQLLPVHMKINTHTQTLGNIEEIPGMDDVFNTHPITHTTILTTMQTCLYVT